MLCYIKPLAELKKYVLKFHVIPRRVFINKNFHSESNLRSTFFLVFVECDLRLWHHLTTENEKTSVEVIYPSAEVWRVGGSCVHLVNYCHKIRKSTSSKLPEETSFY